MTQQNPFLLAAENSPALLPLLRSKPSLASQQDQYGYSLLHAASSYGHLELLRSLTHEFHVDVNLRDEDGETCLFVAETVSMAKCLVEELHVDMNIRNDEGLRAVEKITSEGDFPEVAAYLRSPADVQANVSAQVEHGEAGGSSHPPPLPPNVTLEVGAVDDEVRTGELTEPDPEFRQRIEALAAKNNFHTEDGQRELRSLVTDAVRGVNETREVRQRTG
jgi:uncharacterized protein